MPTQLEFDTSNQPTRIIYANIYLLNYNFQIVDELSGVVVGTPTFSISATSDIRRTCNISLYPKDSSFDIAEGNKIWLDKYIKIEVGIEDLHSGTVAYTNVGVYLINNPSRVYSATNNTMTIEGIDLMAKLTGLRNGELEGLTHIITANTNVRTAIIGTLALAGFTNYICEECPVSVPNDIKISVGGTVYDILKKLRDIIPQYQIYFDVDGVFHYEMIPSGADEQIMVDDSSWVNDLISYTINTDFENVKNSITVIGKTHEISKYSSTTTISGSTYMCTISGVSSLYNNLKIGFTAPSKVTDPSINLNSYGAKALKNEDGTFAVLEDTANVYYVAKYILSGDYWLFMGEVTPMATVEETNMDSPFYVNGTIGKIRKTFSGGEYDNIYMTNLAIARAKWELYNYCRLQDNITLTCVPIYWLDVNKVIEITLPNKQGIEETNKYIVKQISTTFGVEGTQTITAMKYYAYYDE
jgi:hypothetical protein